jgi:hypothetical protein
MLKPFKPANKNFGFSTKSMGKKQFSPPASLEAQSTQRKAGVES